MRRLLLRLLGDQRVRYLLVGGTNTAFSYGVFVASELTIGRTIGYVGSLYLSYALAVTSGFLLHRRITFRAHRTGGFWVVDFLRFASVYVVSLAINTIGLPLLVEVGHLPPIGAQAIMIVITTVISYLGHRFFSFRRGRTATDYEPVEATKSMPSPRIVSEGSSAT